jgi:hypothetical protein
MRKYELTLSGATGGSYELHCSHEKGGPVWASGHLPIQTSPATMMNALMPGMLIYIECDQPEKDECAVVPKVYTITLDGTIWVPAHTQMLTGMASPGARLRYLGWVEEAGVQNPDKRQSATHHLTDAQVKELLR